VPADEYVTPAGELDHEGERVKGSRFLALVAPAPGAEDADAFVERVRAEHPGATHHSWAWRIGPEGETFRSSDDGEPGGSAGRPILRKLEASGLTDAVVVVVRWFGGTKLGVGGLVRAYGGAAGEVLDRVPRRTVVVTRRVELEHDYDLSSAVQGLLAARSLVPVSSDYGERVRLVLEVPRRDLEAFERELVDRTAGRVELREPPLSRP
jgi:uncharacterized YigZ family protein